MYEEDQEDGPFTNADDETNTLYTVMENGVMLQWERRLKAVMNDEDKDCCRRHTQRDTDPETQNRHTQRERERESYTHTQRERGEVPAIVSRLCLTQSSTTAALKTAPPTAAAIRCRHRNRPDLEEGDPRANIDDEVRLR